jgi:hypothetical protein
MTEGRTFASRVGAGSPAGLVRAAWLSALLVGLGLLVAYGPSFCPTALLFGVPCPGCGLTRATLALLHGDVAGALRLHPLAPVLAPLFAAAMAKVVLDQARFGAGRPWTPRFWGGRGVTLGASALLVVLLGVWVARFAGHLGGPAPVESLADLARHAASGDSSR